MLDKNVMDIDRGYSSFVVFFQDIRLVFSSFDTSAFTAAYTLSLNSVQNLSKKGKK